MPLVLLLLLLLLFVLALLVVIPYGSAVVVAVLPFAIRAWLWPRPNRKAS
jgi:hypothetical protein